MDPLNINNEMACLDRKDRAFHDRLDDEQRKKFSTYLMLRWSSGVIADRELQEYYVQSCNHYLNRHFFAVNRHPKLQWLMATAVSPDTGVHKHTWIKPQGKGKSSGNRKLLMQLYPNMKLDEIELLDKLSTNQDIKQLRQDHGIKD